MKSYQLNDAQRQAFENFKLDPASFIDDALVFHSKHNLANRYETETLEQSLRAGTLIPPVKCTLSSKAKGDLSERTALHLMRESFSHMGWTVEDVTKDRGEGDFKLTYNNELSPILIEWKEWVTDVASKHVKEFRDKMTESGRHGIFVSASTGIAGEYPFHLRMVGDLISIHLPNNNYDMNQLASAVHVVIQTSALLSSSGDSVSFKRGLVHKLQLALDVKQTNLDAAIAHQQQALAKLREISFEDTKQLMDKFRTDSQTRVNVQRNTTHQCQTCGKGFRNKRGKEACKCEGL